MDSSAPMGRSWEVLSISISINPPLVVEERTAGVYLKHPTPTPTRLGSGKAICKDRTSKQAGMLAQRLEQVLGDW